VKYTIEEKEVNNRVTYTLMKGDFEICLCPNKEHAELLLKIVNNKQEGAEEYEDRQTGETNNAM